MEKFSTPGGMAMWWVKVLLDHAGTLLGLQSNSGAVASRPHSQTYFKSSILPLQ